MQRLIHQHGAHGHAAREVRTKFHPFKKLSRVAHKAVPRGHAFDLQPGLVLRLPNLGGQRTAHRAGVFARCAQTGQDARRVALIAHHEVHHLARTHRLVALGVSGQQLADAQEAAPAALFRRLGLAQQRGLVIDVEHAGGVFGALGVARHPVQVVCSTAEHGYSSRIQVSLVPPPWDEFTTSEPSCKATRVRPPGTICTVFPLST